MGTRNYKSAKAYSDSKIADIYFTNELSKKLNSNGDDINVVAAHPCWTGTDLQRHSGCFTLVNPFLSQAVSIRALPTLYAAIEGNVKSGSYIGSSGLEKIRGYPKEVAANALANNAEIVRKPWGASYSRLM